MQRFEDYNLAGTRRPAPAPVPDTLADPVLRRTLEQIRQRQTAPTPSNPTRSATTPTPSVPVTLGGLERRPAGAVALGTRGGELAWAMRELRNMDRATLRSMAQADPEWTARVLANLDRLIDQLSKEQRSNGRPSC